MSYLQRFGSDKRILKRRYKKLTGKELDLVNPALFNEKLQWLKLYDRRPIHTQCADKVAVRDFVKEKIGEQYLIPLVGVFNNEKDIIEYELPNYPIILKTNHDSSGGDIVKDKSKVDWQKIKTRLAKQLDRNYYYRGRGLEWQYKDITPKVVVEKLLLTKENTLPYDYKVHCFNGKVEAIQVNMDQFNTKKRNFYSPDWKLLPLNYDQGEPGHDLQKPDRLEEMITLTETLSTVFPYARVDWYCFDNQLHFGEITFYPASGFKEFTPEKWNTYFGELIDISSFEKD